MVLQVAHTLSFGNFGVRTNILGSFWLIENISYLFLLQQERQTHFKAVSSHSFSLSVHNLTTRAD